MWQAVEAKPIVYEINKLRSGDILFLSYHLY